MHRKLWVVSELYYPEVTSTGYILTRIAEGLGQIFATSVICGQPTYSARGVKAPKFECHNGVAIHRCASTTLNKDVLVLRLLNLITITLSLFLHGLGRFRRGDLVMVVTNPPSLPILTLIACRFRRAKCILLVHDIYPDLAIAAGLLNSNALSARIIDQLNGWLFNHVDHVIAIGRDMRHLIAQKSLWTEEHISVITNWADVDQIFPTARDDGGVLEELGIADKFVIQYVGNMGYPNDIESIIEAATQLADDDSIHFLFIGSGVKKKRLEETIRERKLENFTVLPPFPRSEQIRFLNACDLAIISLVSGMKGVSVPSRTYNTLAAGKPILAVTESGSEVDLLVREEQVGWVVAPHSPVCLAKTAKHASCATDSLREMSIRARKIAQEKYSYECVIEQYNRLFGAFAEE